MGVPPWEHIGLVTVAVRMTMTMKVTMSMIAFMIMVCVMRVSERVVNAVMALIPEFHERVNETTAFYPKQPRTQ
jgi:hypothetical protein